MFEPGEVRRKGDVGQAVVVAGEPLVRGQGLLHLVEKQNHALDRNDEVPRLGSLFDHVAAPLALEDIRYLLEHRFSELAAFEILMPERNAEAQDRGRGIVDILVELLGPQAHSGAAVGIQRRQRRIRIGLVEIFENDVRFRDDLLAIDEGRHHGAAVEFEVPGLLVLRRAQHEVAAFPIELLLGEAHPHLLRAERHVVVIERQHCSLPGSLRSFSFRASASTAPARCEWLRSRA